LKYRIEGRSVIELFKSLISFYSDIRLLANYGTYKTSFNTIDDSKVLFSDKHMGPLSPFAIELFSSHFEV